METMQKYRLEFIVKATTWEDVVQLFKDELGIDTGKKDASDRDMEGLFLVQVYMNDDKIDGSFYSKVNKSENIAIIRDPKGVAIRNEILDHVSTVEHHLRKLLLHVSDIVEGYYDYFQNTYAKDFTKNSEIIKSDDPNPITSYLGIEDIIGIFDLDLSSWDGRQIKSTDLLELLEDCNDLQTLKKKLRKKIKKVTLWDHISKHVLQSNYSWDEIKEELGKLRKIRNKAAHFRVVTNKDLHSTKALSKSIIEKTKKKETVQPKDIQKLRQGTYKQFSEALYGTRRLAETIAKMQHDAELSMKLVQPQLIATQAYMDALGPQILQAHELARKILGLPDPKTNNDSALKNPDTRPKKL
ncbi:MAG TPA: hypothetical protein VG964_00055 [Candidatus Saccharimonadales bacterium]|nr:hypothetical protein [Candidatus Saccharimonadales bacterium]